jgi:hypothetical protein
VALAERAPRSQPKGREKPRLAPPVPANKDWREFHDFAKAIGIDLFPWQDYAARYLTAATADLRWLYREVAIIVARQNGKTTLLVPLIIQRLLKGQRIMHTAQNAKLPREVHDIVAVTLQQHYADELPKRRAISYAVGHEEIRLRNGGWYRIVAPTKGGARGPSNDTVIIDELREMDNFDFIGAAKPTLTASKTPQMVYLSNAGTELSLVLNALKGRADEDPSLAYLEWSAGPDRADDELAGWLEANPSIGHMPDIIKTLEDEYRTATLEGTLGIFETEHLCRWVPTLREKLVDDQAWAKSEDPDLAPPRQAVLGIAVAPEGTRASAVFAWRTPQGQTALSSAYEARGNPIDMADLGKELAETATRLGIQEVGYDPLTDGELAKYFKKRAKPITGRAFAVASSTFVNTVEGQGLRWKNAFVVTEDLTWTSRKEHDESGSYQAVRALDDRPITASLAAIRAVWLASGPKPASPRVL